MAPRRGGGGGGSSGWSYDDSSPWNQDYSFSFDYYPPVFKGSMKVTLVFGFLLLTALLAFLAWSFIAKKPVRKSQGLPLTALITSIVCFLIDDALDIVYRFFWILEVTVKQSWVVMLMIKRIFYLVAFLFLFYAFYQIIQIYLKRIANGEKAFTAVTFVHWAVLAILTALSITDFSMNIALQVMLVNGDSDVLDLNSHYAKVTGSRSILYWVASLEILLWAAFISTKSNLLRQSGKTGTIAFAIASLFFFIVNITIMIIEIRYDIEADFWPWYIAAQTPETIVQFMCTLGIYGGLLFCCSQWAAPAAGYPNMYQAPMQAPNQHMSSGVVQSHDR